MHSIPTGFKKWRPDAISKLTPRLALADRLGGRDAIETYYEQQDTRFQQSLKQAREEIAVGKAAMLDDLRHDLEVKERKESRAGRISKPS
jgi:hypothetical protein